MTETDAERDYVPWEEYQEQKALVEALQRKVSQNNSRIETLENKLEHQQGSSSKWQGAKADVVDELEVGQTASHQDLIDLQPHIGKGHAKRNVEDLLRSDWFEKVDRGGSRWRFVGDPEHQ